MYKRQLKNISSAVSVSDVNKDTITKYKVRDQAGGNSFYVSGSAVNASGSGGYEFNASALGTLSVKGDSSSSNQTLQIAAYDGYAWGDWTNFTVTTKANNVPVVGSIADQTLKVGITKNISSLVKATDSDGDTVTKYRVKDTSGVNSFYVSGSAVNASGTNGYEFNASALSTLSVKGDASGSEQTLQVAAYDGSAWGHWVSFKLTSVPNRAPKISVISTL